jgi:hypothetical protein
MRHIVAFTHCVDVSTKATLTLTGTPSSQFTPCVLYWNVVRSLPPTATTRRSSQLPREARGPQHT